MPNDDAHRVTESVAGPGRVTEFHSDDDDPKRGSHVRLSGDRPGVGVMPRITVRDALPGSSRCSTASNKTARLQPIERDGRVVARIVPATTRTSRRALAATLRMCGTMTPWPLTSRPRSPSRDLSRRCGRMPSTQARRAAVVRQHRLRRCPTEPPLRLGSRMTFRPVSSARSHLHLRGRRVGPGAGLR